MMRKTTIAKRLDAAADLIQTYGLRRHGFGTEADGPHCACGAISFACTGDAVPSRHGKKYSDYEEVLAVLMIDIGAHSEDRVYDWSDRAPSKRTVYSTFRRIAKQLRGEA